MEVIAYGATTEEAIEKGCRELGLSREEVKFEVIELPKSKTLGLFGGSPASVRVFVENDQGQDAADYLDSIIKAMGLEGISVEVEPNEDNTGVTLNLKGENLGAVIGRRGETLAALQYLVSLAANNSGEEYFRVAINIGNYREKREGSLENLARKTALRSIKIGRNLALDPMNPYERRIVHTAVQSVEGATSWSVDEGTKRHVVIGPVGVAEGEEGLPVNHSRNGKPGGARQGFGGRTGNYNSRGSYGGSRGGYGNNRSSYNRSGYNRYNNDGENRGYNRDRYSSDDSEQTASTSGGYSRGYGESGSYNRSYNRGYNRDTNGERSGYNRENNGERGSYNRDGGNRSGYNRDNQSRGGYGRRDNAGGYNRNSSRPATPTEQREAKKDISAPLYGRIVPKKETKSEE